MSLESAAQCAKQCVQILGGIGFTWEHDAHFYLKRAMANLQLVAGGDVGSLEHEVTAMAVGGARRNLAADLPAEAESLRDEVRAVVAQVAAADDRRAAMAEAGLHHAALARPWGRGAVALEQLVIDEELAAAGVARPHLAVGAWALPTSSRTGPRSSRSAGCARRCSAPSAGASSSASPAPGPTWPRSARGPNASRAATCSTGRRCGRRWPTWPTSGICLARSDPDAAKHAGITYFIVDMHAEGIDIRPLRELTGAAMFNEVFFNDVFVPDDAVVGAPGDGWRIGRTTLANERVSMSSGASFGNGVESLIRTVARRGERGEASPPSLEGRLGHLIAEAQSIALLGHRSTLRTLSGVDPGSGSSVRKLLGVEHEQRVQEMGMALYGANGAVLDGKAQRWEEGFLSTRCLTIAGGTSEVQRNVIAERILGQPRDPEPGT